MMKVPVGVSTVAGYSVTLGSVVLAALAYLDGDRSEQTVGIIVAGTVALVSFAITQIGRYVQARALIAQAPPVVEHFTGYLQPEKITFITPTGQELADTIGDADDEDEPEADDVAPPALADLPETTDPPKDIIDTAQIGNTDEDEVA